MKFSFLILFAKVNVPSVLNWVTIMSIFMHSFKSLKGISRLLHKQSSSPLDIFHVIIKFWVLLESLYGECRISCKSHYWEIKQMWFETGFGQCFCYLAHSYNQVKASQLRGEFYFFWIGIWSIWYVISSS